jgi:alpha-galactosidase
MTKLDAATLQILTNDEVIDINQDPLGHQAAPAEKQGAIEIWTKDLEGGAKAYGLFNRGSSAAKATVKFDKRRSARDLWAHRDLGRLESWSDEVSPHGVVLLTAR